MTLPDTQIPYRQHAVKRHVALCNTREELGSFWIRIILYIETEPNLQIIVLGLHLLLSHGPAPMQARSRQGKDFQTEALVFTKNPTVTVYYISNKS